MNKISLNDELNDLQDIFAFKAQSDAVGTEKGHVDRFYACAIRKKGTLAFVFRSKK